MKQDFETSAKIYQKAREDLLSSYEGLILKICSSLSGEFDGVLDLVNKLGIHVEPYGKDLSVFLSLRHETKFNLYDARIDFYPTGAEIDYISDLSKLTYGEQIKDVFEYILSKLPDYQEYQLLNFDNINSSIKFYTIS